jgi:hypothetical protein
VTKIKHGHKLLEIAQFVLLVLCAYIWQHVAVKKCVIIPYVINIAVQQPSKSHVITNFSKHYGKNLEY